MPSGSGVRVDFNDGVRRMMDELIDLCGARRDVGPARRLGPNVRRQVDRNADQIAHDQRRLLGLITKDERLLLQSRRTGESVTTGLRLECPDAVIMTCAIPARGTILPR